MIDILFNWVLPVSVGMVLGLFFFLGLWWTVRKAVHARVPALWFLLSMLLRFALVLGGFYLVGRGNMQALLLCLGGFIVIRLIMQRYITGEQLPANMTQELDHAS